MFGKREAAAAKSVGKERFGTLIGERSQIQGDLSLSDSIRIDGQIDGNTRRRDGEAVTVVVGQSGKVIGDIDATRVVIAGTVRGSVRAEQDVELHETAVVEGDVHCKALRVALGARLNGRIITSEQPPSGKPVLVVDQGEMAETAVAKRA